MALFKVCMCYDWSGIRYHSGLPIYKCGTWCAGHFMLPVSVGLEGAGAAAKKHLDAIAELHDHHVRDAGESLFLAYEAGSYSKVRPAC